MGKTDTAVYERGEETQSAYPGTALHEVLEKDPEWSHSKGPHFADSGIPASVEAPADPEEKKAALLKHRRDQLDAAAKERYGIEDPSSYDTKEDLVDAILEVDPSAAIED